MNLIENKTIFTEYHNEAPALDDNKVRHIQIQQIGPAHLNVNEKKENKAIESLAKTAKSDSFKSKEIKIIQLI